MEEIKIDTSGFEKALKYKKAKIESHAKYPVQGIIENKLKRNYQITLESSCKQILKYLTDKL